MRGTAFAKRRVGTGTGLSSTNNRSPLNSCDWVIAVIKKEIKSYVGMHGARFELEHTIQAVIRRHRGIARDLECSVAIPTSPPVFSVVGS